VNAAVVTGVTATVTVKPSGSSYTFRQIPYLQNSVYYICIKIWIEVNKLRILV